MLTLVLIDNAVSKVLALPQRLSVTDFNGAEANSLLAIVSQILKIKNP